MPCKITNRSAQNVLVRLKCGQTIHLRPGESVDHQDEADVHGNDRIDSLKARGLLKVEYEPGKPKKKPAVQRKAPAKKKAVAKPKKKAAAKRKATGVAK